MPHVEYACEGRLLFRPDPDDGGQFVPRIHEVVVIQSQPYIVVDVEYSARDTGPGGIHGVWPTVYVVPMSKEDWQLRLERRKQSASAAKIPVRY